MSWKALISLIGELLTSVPTTTRRAEKHLKPIIEQRLRSIEENGPDYPDKPVRFFLNFF